MTDGRGGVGGRARTGTGLDGSQEHRGLFDDDTYGLSELLSDGVERVDGLLDL